MLKWLVILGAVLLLVIVLVVGGLFYQAGREGSSAVEAWVATQLKAIAGGYLNPELGFEDLDYQYPRTVELKELRLVAADPAQAGEQIDILRVKKLRLELAEIPRTGQPIQIKALVLEQPEFRAIAIEPGVASFVGYSDLLKSDTQRQREPAPAPRLSEVFQIRLIQIKDGLIVYDTRQPGIEPMHLDQINTRMGVEPEGGGWYTLKTDLRRKPVFETDIDGRLNIDTMALDLEQFDMDIQLGPEQNRYLPPGVQALLNRHKVTGRLDMKIKGVLELQQWRQSALDVQLALTDGNISFGEYRFPVEELRGQAAMRDQRLALSNTQAKTLGGTLDLAGEVALNDALDAQLQLKGQRLRIENTLEVMARDPKAQPKYAGLVDTTVNFRGPLTDWATRAAGDGEIRLTEGHLARLPVLAELLAVVAQVGKITRLQAVSEQAQARDEATSRFELRGDRIVVRDLDARVAVLGLTGTGDIFMDNRLDLRINAVPLDKVQGSLGRVGDIISKVGGEVLGYNVTGTLGEPKMQPAIVGAPKGVLDRLLK